MRSVRRYGGSSAGCGAVPTQGMSTNEGGVNKITRNKTASDGDVSAGATLRWSRDALASVLNEAQCAGFSTSIPEQGMPSIICAPLGVASCGQTYDAIAIPELTTVRTRKKAM